MYKPRVRIPDTEKIIAHWLSEIFETKNELKNALGTISERSIKAATLRAIIYNMETLRIKGMQSGKNCPEHDKRNTHISQKYAPKKEVFLAGNLWIQLYELFDLKNHPYWMAQKLYNCILWKTLADINSTLEFTIDDIEEFFYYNDSG